MLILTQHLPTTLEASLLVFLITDWKSTKSRNASMFNTMWFVQPLSTSMPAVFHWVRAAQYSSPGEANVGSIATDSCLPPSLCLLHALSLWPFSPQLLHCAVSFLLQSLEKCLGIPHTEQFSFLGFLLEVTLHWQCRWTTLSFVHLCCALTEVLQPFPQLCEFVAGLKLSCITKLSYLIGRPLWTKALKRVTESASPASCSLVSKSSDEQAIQILSILELQSSKLCHQSHHCRRLHTLKSLLQKLPTFYSISEAVISHIVMSHQHEGCCI